MLESTVFVHPIIHLTIEMTAKNQILDPCNSNSPNITLFEWKSARWVLVYKRGICKVRPHYYWFWHLSKSGNQSP